MKGQKFTLFRGINVFFLFSLLSFNPLWSLGQVNCGDPGKIKSGSSATLNPNADSYFSNTNSPWTVTTEEYTEFEILNPGSGGANVGWTPFLGIEPTGINVPSDVGAGGNCGNTDITTDSNGGSDYAYYTIVDPDEIPNNGDEYIAFAMRIADQISGAFTFSFLIDSDNNCGSDPDATCGNPCFEYEIQLNTQNREVILISIDGCAGTSDCDTRNGPSTPNGTDAYVCNPCNNEALQVCAGSSECGTNNPVFWLWYIHFSEMGGLNSTDQFSIAPTTTTSPNSVIYKNTNVSDFGGIGNPNDPSECDCATQCSGSSCADCEQDCALSCSSQENNFNSFPVEFQAFNGKWESGNIILNWETATELNNSHFVVEKTVDGVTFDDLATLSGAGTSQYTLHYSFVDHNPVPGVNYYRIKQVDFDGKFSFSQLLSVRSEEIVNQLSLSQTTIPGQLNIHLLSHRNQRLTIELFDLQGRLQKTINYEAWEGSQAFTMSTPELSSGIYFLRLSNHQQETLDYQKFLFKN
ncbi:MAG: T9SS type A sorting domain-containing protein [Bacteroidetes bacterium]|nr:T9SS type A sorting domain-containing protein [Bacteroidota bacterium]